MKKKIQVKMCCASINRPTRFWAGKGDTILVQTDSGSHEAVIEDIDEQENVIVRFISGATGMIESIDPARVKALYLA